MAAVDQEGLRRAGVIPVAEQGSYTRSRFRSDSSGQEEPMSVVEVDRATGALVVGERKLFPIVLSNGPPVGAKAPNGEDALAELAAGGANFIRVGRPIWNPESGQRGRAGSPSAAYRGDATGSRSRAARCCSSTCKTRSHRASSRAVRRSGLSPSPTIAFATGSRSTTPGSTAFGGSDGLRAESRP